MDLLWSWPRLGWASESCGAVLYRCGGLDWPARGVLTLAVLVPLRAAGVDLANVDILALRGDSAQGLKHLRVEYEWIIQQGGR